MLYKHKNGIEFRKMDFEDLPDLTYIKEESWYGTHTIAIVKQQTQEEWFKRINNNNNYLYLIAYCNENEKNLFAKVGLYKIQNIDWINRTYDSADDVFKQ